MHPEWYDHIRTPQSRQIAQRPTNADPNAHRILDWKVIRQSIVRMRWGTRFPQSFAIRQASAATHANRNRLAGTVPICLPADLAGVHSVPISQG